MLTRTHCVTVLKLRVLPDSSYAATTYPATGTQIGVAQTESSLDPSAYDACIVNEDNRHWVALKKPRAEV